MIWLITPHSGFPTTPAPKICGKEGFGRLALIGLGNRGEGNEQQIALGNQKAFFCILASLPFVTCIQFSSCPDRSIDIVGATPLCRFGMTPFVEVGSALVDSVTHFVDME